MKQKLLFSLLCCLFIVYTQAQTLEECARTKIDSLQLLITILESKSIDTQREKLTINTAEIFLFYAIWDEQHINENKSMFDLVNRYKNNSLQMAEGLADAERRDVITILDESIKEANLLIDGAIFRKATPAIDWAKATHDGDQITYNGRPVFLNDYTWKPQKAGDISLDEFFGQQDGYYFDQNRVENQRGSVKSWVVKEIKEKESGKLGFIFLGNKGVPAWTKEKYGNNFNLGIDRYTIYDIDHPGAKELNSYLFQACIPHMAGKKYSELGYMMCNEPHFYTTKTGDKVDWASGTVSEYTKAKFRTWLSEKHASIQDLNSLWGTNFASFDKVEIEIPIDNSLQGTPKWYDWQSFNNFRVTEWYKWVKSEMRKYDAEAKVHLKVMPNLWTENKRGHGLDMEALTELSEIIGNDFGSENSYMWGGPKEWEENYAMEWREFCMGHDFFKSVSPDKICYNTELHYLSKGNFRDINLDPKYVRATYWLSHSLGATANQVWFWPRLNDGSIKSNAGKGYAGSNIHQPRVTREAEATIMDLNSFSEEIMVMQRQRKPLRIFYSETSAQNKPKHMDDVFHLYEDVVFEGVPVGFATKNIIARQDNNSWDAILIYKTPYVTRAERDTLQAYLNRGGVIFIDSESIKRDEYGKAIPLLNEGSGKLTYVSSLSNLKIKAFQFIEAKGLLPKVDITESNSGGHKGCFWKCIENKDGNQVLSVVNLGKTDAKLNVTLKNAKIATACKDLLTGVTITSKPVLKPYDVYFVEVSDADVSGSAYIPNKQSGEMGKLYPNPANDKFVLDFFTTQRNVELNIFNLSGINMVNRIYASVESINQDISSFPQGSYVVTTQSELEKQSFILLKQ